MDPEVQTLDMDLRNNSTKMKKTILFDWPGIWYNPRDEMVYWWSPNFYFNSDDSDFAPGLNIKKDMVHMRVQHLEPIMHLTQKKSIGI